LIDHGGTTILFKDGRTEKGEHKTYQVDEIKTIKVGKREYYQPRP